MKRSYIIVIIALLYWACSPARETLTTSATLANYRCLLPLPTAYYVQMSTLFPGAGRSWCDLGAVGHVLALTREMKSVILAFLTDGNDKETLSLFSILTGTDHSCLRIVFSDIILNSFRT